MAAQLPEITLYTTGGATAKEWRVWMGDYEITHYLTDIAIKAGYSEATQITLTCHARLRTLKSETAGNY